MLCGASTYQGYELEGTIGMRADSCCNSDGALHHVRLGGPSVLTRVSRDYSARTAMVRFALVREVRSEGLHVC
jgi:hypothetical protein